MATPRGRKARSYQPSCDYTLVNMAETSPRTGAGSNTSKTPQQKRDNVDQEKEMRQFFGLLQKAITSRNYRSCEEQLERGFDVNICDDKYFFHPLLLAAKKGYSEIVELLLDKGADINVQDKKKTSALHYAIQQRNEHCSLLILNRGIRAKVPDFEENLPLHIAVTKGMTKVVRSLLEKGGNPNAKGKAKKTPVHFAAEMGQTDILKLLLQNGGEWNSLDKLERRPLHWAAFRNHHECCEILLAASSDRRSDHARYSDKEGQTPLILAAAKGNSECCKCLLNDSDVNSFDKGGNSALHYASKGGYFNTVEVLLKLKPQVLAKNLHNNTAIHLLIRESSYASKDDKVEHRYYKCLKALITYSDADAGLNKLGQSTIYHAVKSNWINALTLLLEKDEHKKHLDAQDTEGNNPFSIALKKGYTNATEILLSKGCCLTTHDNNFDTPLHIAASKGMVEMCKRLLTRNRWKGFDSANKEGKTPLHLAARNGSVECCKLLCSSTSTVDSYGYNAFHHAAERGNLGVLQLLAKRNRNIMLEETAESRDTSLHLTVKKGYYDCCEFLLSKMNKNFINRQNLDNRTVLDEAFYRDKDDIFGLILSRMAKSEKVPQPKMTKKDKVPQPEITKNNIVLHTKATKSTVSSPQMAKRNEIPDLKLSKSGSKSDEVSDSQLVKSDEDPDSQLAKGDEDPDSQLAKSDEDPHSQLAKRDEVPDPQLSKSDKVPDLPLHASLHKYSHIAIEKDKKQILEFIIKSAWWRSGFSSMFCREENSPCQNLNNLTVKDPNLTEMIYDRCVEVFQSSQRLYDFSIFEDSHYVPLHKKSDYLKRHSSFDPTTGRFLIKEAKMFEKPELHPLTVAVNEGHANLLKHELTRGYLKYRWLSDIKKWLITMLIIEIFVVAVLGTFLINTWNWDTLAKKMNATNKNFTENFSFEMYDTGFIDDHWDGFIWRYLLLLAVAFFVLLKEIIYSYKLRDSTYSLASILRISRLIGIVFLVFPFGLRFNYYIAIKETWEWQIGVLALLAAWFHMIHILNKIPSLSGFMPVTAQFVKSFLRILLYILLMIVIFAFIFYLLLPGDKAFTNIVSAFVKTTVWLLGDLSYNDTFLNEDAQLLYPLMTNIIFLLLVTSITGMIVNLFIYLPSDQRSQLQDEAILFKIIRQIRLTVDLDKLFLNMKLKKLNIFWKDTGKESVCYRYGSKFFKRLRFHQHAKKQKVRPNYKIENETLSLQSILKAIEDLRRDVQELKKEIGK